MFSFFSFHRGQHHGGGPTCPAGPVGLWYIPCSGSLPPSPCRWPAGASARRGMPCSGNLPPSPCWAPSLSRSWSHPKCAQCAHRVCPQTQSHLWFLSFDGMKINHLKYLWTPPPVWGIVCPTAAKESTRTRQRQSFNVNKARGIFAPVGGNLRVFFVR